MHHHIVTNKMQGEDKIIACSFNCDTNNVNKIVFDVELKVGIGDDSFILCFVCVRKSVAVRFASVRAKKGNTFKNECAMLHCEMYNMRKQSTCLSKSDMTKLRFNNK